MYFSPCDKHYFIFIFESDLDGFIFFWSKHYYNNSILSKHLYIIYNCIIFFEI